MKKGVLILLLIVVIGLFYFFNLDREDNGVDYSNIECSSDLDCGTGGCSGQVCTTKEKAADLVTTCEYREEYSCLRLTSCGCIQGKCKWQETQDYLSCLNDLR